ncbi:VOC family protein [Streptomyces sp. NPDC058726]|uniref:VOC family protein n=1 Tax=Streptomyces sp. NPDC058726 TaxID=3346611 RepID=UPI0036A075E4
MSSARLSTVVLDARDAHEPARFCVRLLGYEVRAEGPHWMLIGTPGGAAGLALAFETEPGHVPPVRPTRNPGDQQMMLHLGVEVDGLDAETARAVAEGATSPVVNRRPTSGCCSTPPGTRSVCGCGPLSRRVPGCRPSWPPGRRPARRRCVRPRGRPSP